MHGPLNVKPSRLLTHTCTWINCKPTLTYGRLKDLTIPHIKGLHILHNCPHVTKGNGIDLFRLSDMLHFEKTETAGNHSLNFVRETLLKRFLP